MSVLVLLEVQVSSKWAMFQTIIIINPSFGEPWFWRLAHLNSFLIFTMQFNLGMIMSRIDLDLSHKRNSILDLQAQAFFTSVYI